MCLCVSIYFTYYILLSFNAFTHLATAYLSVCQFPYLYVCMSASLYIVLSLLSISIHFLCTPTSKCINKLSIRLSTNLYIEVYRKRNIYEESDKSTQTQRKVKRE